MSNFEFNFADRLTGLSRIRAAAGGVGVEVWPVPDQLGPETDSLFLPRADPQTQPGPVGRAARARRRSDRQASEVHAPLGHVVGETMFRHALARERSRGERLEQVFAVLFIQISDRAPETQAVLRRIIAETVDPCAVVGWLTQDELLGILLPDLGLSAAGVVRDTELRIWQRLNRELGSRASRTVSIRAQLHPSAAGNDALNALLADAMWSTRHGGVWLDASKRVMDLLGSGLALLVLSPVFVAVAILIKILSRGPVLFRQVRLGQDAQPFTMLKFRSMYVNADSASHQRYAEKFINSRLPDDPNDAKVFKMLNDPRITPIGRVLRQTSLDELPQFWNVLRGDMSLVGPRPPLRYELEQYRPWHWRRVREAKPGITGLWQVKGRSRTTFDEMVRLDLQYVRTRSLWLDVKILLATPVAVLSGKGAC